MQNSNLTWFTDNPDFPECFQNSILAWIPYIFLFLFTPLELYNIRASQFRNIPTNFLTVTKQCGLIILLIHSMIILYGALTSNIRDTVEVIDFATPLIKIIGLVSFIIYIHFL